MRQNTFSTILLWLLVLLASAFASNKVYATHAQSADITYKCLGGNQYQINVSFYRDCAGVAAPNAVTINLISATCGQNFSTTLNPLPGTGVDVTQVCNNVTTICNGGTYPGVEEYIYEGIVTLPANCNDWVFSFSLCCRNNAINTINNPSGENIYVEAQLNNLDFPCNNSPSFSNPPVATPCIGQVSCFNHGAIEPDGDSLYYSLQTPATGPTTEVTYLAGYNAQQPLLSSPAITFNSTTGDICMSPTQIEVIVLAVKVEEWRNGVFAGSVVRDIQMRTVSCTNTVPSLTGVNGSGQFTTTACAGTPLNFTIPSTDPDIGQNVTLTWNNSIPGATFVSNGAQIPTGTFSWTPAVSDISAVPYCFTATVQDDNCPLIGSQVYSFCITVSGFTTSATSISANCGASNGSATVAVSGGTGPYTYQWSPKGGNSATAHGLLAGIYTVNVTDALGCQSSSTVNVGTGPLPGNINMIGNNVTCYGGNDGSATANVNGGGSPYIYSWSNGDSSSTISNLSTGTYYITVTSIDGCTSSDSVTITQPATPLTLFANTTDVSCFGGNNGTATAFPSGGTPPYSFLWDDLAAQTTATATGLTAGSYSITVTDNNGWCITLSGGMVNEPPLLTGTITSTNTTCFGSNDGIATVTPLGGTAPYTYSWNDPTNQTAITATGLTAGNYTVVITDNNGCVTTLNTTITQPTQITTSLINQQNVSCFGGNDGAITAVPSGGTTPYSYSWNTIPIQNNMVATNLSAGTYTISIIDNNLCVATQNVSITQPILLTSSSTTTIVSCFGGNDGTATVSPLGGTSPYSYLWDDLGAQTTATATGLIAKNHSVIITDNNGCSTTQGANITEPTQLTVTLNGQQNVSCFNGNNGSATTLPNGGSAPYSVSWNTAPIQNNLTASALSAGTYTATITDNKGCIITQDATITEPTQLSVALNGQQNVNCFGGHNGSITATATGGKIPYTYLWNDPATQTSITATGLMTGTYMAIITDSNGCIAGSNNTTITGPSNALNISIINKQDITCFGYTNGLIQTATTGGTAPYSYQWNPTFSTSSFITNLGTGNYVVTVTDNNGCTDIISELIVEPTPVTTVVKGSSIICPGDSATITVSASGGVGKYFYHWDNFVYDSIQTVSPSSKNTYTAFAIDGNNCMGNTDSATITVNDINLATLAAAADTSICKGESLFINANIKGGIGPYTLVWNHGLGTGSGPFLITPSLSTNYIVSVTDVCGNATSESIIIGVNPVPQVNLTPQTMVECGQATLNLSNASGNIPAGSTYIWSFGDNTFSNESNPIKNYDQSGLYHVTLNVTSPFGCKGNGDAFMDITVKPQATADFEFNPQDPDMLESTVIFENNSSTSSNYRWSFGDGDSSFLENPAHRYKLDGAYTVTLFSLNSFGCPDSISKELNVAPFYGFYIPNTFTPNADGKNDIFSAVGEEISNFHMEIFTRWGEMIYESNNIDNGWDGTAKGRDKISQTGVYVYVIQLQDYEGKTYDLRGHINLLK